MEKGSSRELGLQSHAGSPAALTLGLCKLEVVSHPACIASTVSWEMQVYVRHRVIYTLKGFEPSTIPYWKGLWSGVFWITEF